MRRHSPRSKPRHQQVSQANGDQAGQQLINSASTMTYEGAGPDHIKIDEFDGVWTDGHRVIGRLVKPAGSLHFDEVAAAMLAACSAHRSADWQLQQ